MARSRANGHRDGGHELAKAHPKPANETASPPRRAFWKGSISFGLVQIPVTLHNAERTHELSFHQLDRRDNAPIGYERVNKATGKPVAWSDIVKGYELDKGEWVVLDDEDFRKANVQASQTIDIQDFVDAREIPPTYFERPYYVLPDKRGEKAYAVLRDALKKKGRIGIALVVLRTRQHLCAIVPEGDLLILELLRFEHELRPAAEIEPPRAGAKPTAKELAMAEQLIEGMVSHWNPSKYRDQYRDDLLQAIRQKAKTGVIEPSHVPTERPAAPTDLLALLRKSIASTGGAHHASRRKSGKTAA
jgi:DNA end-binding protein Ku